MTAEPGPRRLTWFDHIPININWFALALRAQVLSGFVVPLLVQTFVGEGQKGSYFGSLRLWSLMVALLSQAAFGLLSDNFRSRLGRRRPFILVGEVGQVLVLLVMVWIAGQSGPAGYTLLFAASMASMAFSNMSQAGTQGLIPDLVPQDQRGLTSGVKTLLEVPLPLALVALFLGPMVGRGELTRVLLFTALAALACMGVTMLVREKSTAGSPVVRNLRPLLSLVLMTAVFTATILGLGWAVRVSLAALGEGSRLPAVLLGTLAMVLAVVVGVAGSLAVHQDRGVRRNRPFMAWIIARLAALVALNSVTTFLLYFIQDKYRIPAGEAAALVARLPVVVGGFVLAFGLVAGRLADRYDRRLLTALGALLGGLGVGVLVLGQAVNTLYVAAGVIGLSYVLFQVASWALGADIIPPERSGEFLGLQNLAGAGAGAIGAYIGGTIADHTGYVWMMVMFGGMFWLSAAATLFIRTESLRPYAGQTASGSG